MFWTKAQPLWLEKNNKTTTTIFSEEIEEYQTLVVLWSRPTQTHLVSLLESCRSVLYMDEGIPKIDISLKVCSVFNETVIKY